MDSHNTVRGAVCQGASEEFPSVNVAGPLSGLVSLWAGMAGSIPNAERRKTGMKT